MPERRPEQQLAQLLRYLNSRGDKPPQLPTGLVRRQRLGPLAYQHGFNEFKSDFIQHALFAELRNQQLFTVVNSLADSDIRVILFKGISYCNTIYADPAERSMGDVDLVVVPCQFRSAQTLIESLGYHPRHNARERSQFHHAITLDKGQFTIDLHRHVYQPWRSRINMASAWARATPVLDAGNRAWRFSPEDELLFHLVHIARNEMMVSAISYLDIPRLETRAGISRAQLRVLAQQSRINRAISAVLSLSDAIHNGHSTRQLACKSFVGPSLTEVLGKRPLHRCRQIAIKAQLSEGPRELLGLGLGYLLERSPW